MRKKTVSMIFAGLTALSGILPHAPKIIPEGNSLIAAAAIAATLSIPSKSVAAIMPARIVQLAAISMSRNCEAGVMDQLCSSVTSFLNDEATKTDADLKACKDKCGWKKRKDDLIDAARKKAKESCSKGEAPNVNELSKGLDWNPPSVERITELYNSYMARNEHTGFGSGADQNVNENFAFAAGLYFGNTNYFQYDTSAGFADLQKHQPEMFELFIKIFGTTKSPAI